MAKSNIKPLLLFALAYFVILASCSGSISQQSSQPSSIDYSLYSPLLVKNQLPAPQSIKSIELYRKGNRKNPPILKLESSDKLILEFDELSSLSGQYSVRFTHHNQDWSYSNIPDAWFIDGINDVVVQNGDANHLSKPNYYHYNLEFPNQQINFLASGNYMLHVFDYASNIKLFSLPFFISEELGTIKNSIETLHAGSGNFATSNQLFSVYEQPKEVMFPQFDLSFSYIQNRLWNNYIIPTEIDASNSDQIRFYTSRNNSFDATFDFIHLDLTDFNIDNRRIIDWQPEFTPPKVILKEDVLNFSSTPSRWFESSMGYPSKSSNARYANVIFRLDAGDLAKPDSEFYVIGDFNQWNVSEANRLILDRDTGLLEASIIIKEGVYRYKYFLKSDYAESDFVPINDAITDVEQDYIGFIYYRDPDYNYQRLLQTTNFSSSN